MKTILYGFLFCACLGQYGCKKPDNPPVPITGSNQLTDTERMEVLETCRTRFASLLSTNPANARQQLLTWLQAQPYFEKAGFATEENNVWARFKDGRFVMFVNNLKPVPYDQQGGRISVESQDAPVPTMAGARTGELPSDKKVVILNGMGTAFIDPIGAIRQIFTASKKNYQLTSDKASIKNLKTMDSDLAVFYLSTHGGAADSLRTRAGKSFPATLGFWTTDSCTVKNEADYKDDLDNQRLGYMIAYNNQPTPKDITVEKHYAFTSEFVKEHMHFGENSLIYFTACNGFRQAPSGINFRETIISKAKNKHAAFLGWTQPIYEGDGYVAAKYLFDRLLGANSSNAAGTSFPIPKEDPNQRPFDLAAVMKDMEAKGLTQSNVVENGTTVRADLMCYNKIAPDDHLILAPSIAYVLVDEMESKLHLFGIFGTDPQSDGQVTVDGVAMKTDSWKKDEIVCPIPTTGKGSAGDIIVTVRDQPSNAVQLTEWQWKVQLTRTYAGSLKETLEANLHLRADVHAYRKVPHGTPGPYVYQYPLPGLDSAQGLRPVSDSKGLYTAGGTASTKWNAGECSATDTEDWAGISVGLPLLDGPISSPKDHMAPSCWLNPKTRTMEVSFEWLAKGHHWTYQVNYVCPKGGNSQRKDQGDWYGQGIFLTPYFRGLQGLTEDEVFQFGIDKVKFDENFNIQAYQKSFTVDADAPFIHLENKRCTVSFKWAAVTAKFPPRKDAGARLEWQ
jgi:hypothetical protein